MPPRRWLIEDWHIVLMRAWSIRFIVLAGLLSGLEVALPMVSSAFTFNGRVALALSIGSGLATAAAFVARLLAQNSLPGLK